MRSLSGRAVMACAAILITSLSMEMRCEGSPAASTPLELAMTAAASDPPRNLDTHHLFTPPSDRKQWEARKKALREQILMSAGLWPMPKKTPLKPMFTGKIDAPDYTVENVALETRPGFFLCGNLYRPKGKTGPFPGIVNPHGHWSNGRLEMQPDVPKAPAAPGKMGEGRGNLVAIGVNLARQGHVVFAYDAVGYNDTNQVTHDFAKSLKPWLWNVSEMGLQLWDSIRVVDFLQSLSDVDKSRIGCTGASGGGSQTFLLTAVDDRIAAAVPVNMVSAQMQGGCLCENGPGLRVGTDNVEVAAMMAPKPMLMVACTGDWTKNNPTEEWPAVKKVYDLYSAGDHTAVLQFNYQHNYNVESREAMYAWFGKWLLHDDNPEHFRERPFEADVKAMHVWTASQPMPSTALKEAALIESMTKEAETNLDSIWPASPSGLSRFRAVAEPAFRNSLFVSYPPRQRIGVSGIQRAAIVVAEEGDRAQAEAVKQALLGKGAHVAVTIMLLPPVTVKPETLWAAYFTTYNRAPIGDRVAMVVNNIADMEAAIFKRVDLVGVGKAGLTALLARGVLPAGREVGGSTVVDTAGFESSSDEAFIPAYYAPGLRRAGDFSTAAMLAAPNALCLFNTGSSFKTERIEKGYKAVRAPLKVESGALSPEQIAEWLAAR